MEMGVVVNNSQNTGQEFTGSMILYLPRRLFAVGATWVGPRRLYVSGQAVHRSRFPY
jgi:hypothetical protein